MKEPKPPTRRNVLKGALYVAPAVLTLAASPSYAKSGSWDKKKKKKSDWDEEWD